MRNDKYWANRMRILEESLLDTGYDYVKNLERQYATAIQDIESQIAKWYQRFATENGITLAEANKLLTTQELDEFRWTVEEYIKYGQENAVSQAWYKQLKNASARVHVSRLDSLKLQLQAQAEALHGAQTELLETSLAEVYERGYYHTAFELQKGIGVGWTLHGLTDDTIKKVLARPWTLDAQTFSDRIWANKQALVNSVNTQLTQTIMRGAAPDKAIKAIADRFKVSRSQAGRLVMTETAAFASMARKDCFTDLGVKKYVIVETLDKETCSLCGSLDGKVYPMSEYKVGVTAPPFHPWCRGTTAPYYEDMENLGDRFARDDEGKRYTVPKDMTYKEWFKRSVVSTKNDKSPFTSQSDRGIMDSREMAMGLRQPASRVLTPEEIDSIKADAKALQIDSKVLRFNTGTRTGFLDHKEIINICGDVLPDTESHIARDKMSQRAVLAYEYYGHFLNHPSEYPIGDWRDEFRASYDAAVKAPNLTDEDRALLMIDAYDRAHEAGVVLNYDETAVKIIYGY